MSKQETTDWFFWIGVLVAGAILSAAMWKAHTLNEADRIECEAGGRHTFVLTQRGLECIEARRVVPQ